MVSIDTESQSLNPENEYVTVVKSLSNNGNSLCVNITNEAGLLGLRAGDRVKITITRTRD